jgi:hypothetical protein
MLQLGGMQRSRKTSLVFRATMLQRRTRIQFKSDYSAACEKISVPLHAALQAFLEVEEELSIAGLFDMMDLSNEGGSNGYIGGWDPSGESGSKASRGNL